MKRKPDFFLVGAAKSGTSSLYNYLVQHPFVFMPEPKEPHFFGEWRPPVQEVKGMKEYLRFFEGVPEDVRAGEASTSYLYSTDAAWEIKRFRPDAKIIVILRDPVSRAYSQYWNQVREGVEPLDFEEALAAEAERRERGWWYGFHYVEAGRYASQVARYLNLFGRESVRVYLFEDLVQDADAVCDDVFSFLAVEPRRTVSVAKAYNQSGAPRSLVVTKAVHKAILLSRALQRQWRGLVSGGSSLPVDRLKEAKDWIIEKNSGPVPEMNPSTRAELREIYKGDLLRLQELIQRDLNRWM